MELYQKITLYSHIASGGFTLLSGLAPMITKKGSTIHRRAGMVYFYTMVGVVVTAAAICLPRIHEYKMQFLLTIAVFSFYMAYTGRRVLQLRTGEYQLIDKVVLGAILLCTIAMFLLQNFILAIFGILLLRLCYVDMKIYLYWDELKRKEHSEFIMKSHIGKMIGAYIATITAFILNNFHFDSVPYYVPWFSPALIFIPFIIYWSRKYDKKQSTHETTI